MKLNVALKLVFKKLYALRLKVFDVCLHVSSLALNLTM